MSSSKKICNRLNKLFSSVERSEAPEEPAKERPAVERTVERPPRRANSALRRPRSKQQRTSLTEVRPDASVFALPFQVASEWNLLELEADPSYEWEESEQRLVRQVADQPELALQNALLLKQTEAQNQGTFRAERDGTRKFPRSFQCRKWRRPSTATHGQLMDVTDFFVRAFTIPKRRKSPSQRFTPTA